MVVVRGKGMKKKGNGQRGGEELSKLQLVEANKNHCSWATMGKRERLRGEVRRTIGQNRQL